MAKDIDEDLIEATIRRVQAQTPPLPDDADAESPAPPDEDPIEATIRRVREQAARAASAPQDEDVPQAELDADDPIEATIRRVQEQAARAGSDVVAAAIAAGEKAVADEDPIEATIRRVQEQASDKGAEPEHAETMATSDDDDPIAATIRRVNKQAASRVQPESSEFAPAPLPPLDDDDADQPAAVSPAAAVQPRDIEDTAWPGRDERLLGEPSSWEVAAKRLEQGLQDNSRQVRELAARLDAILPVIEQMLAGRPATPALTVVRPQAPQTDDDWDDRPSVSPMQFGAPPRPPVLRDPSPNTATAQQLEEVAPAPAAHLVAVDKGSLDSRLPRQYRITVEDKRRGVDLVPLHRAMQGLQNVRDMSLLSYNNGVAIVLIETVGELEPEILREAVARAMARETKIEVHNESTMVVKVQED